MLRTQQAGRFGGSTLLFFVITIACPAVSAAAPSRQGLQRRLVRALGHRDPAVLERAARRLGLAGMIAALDSPKTSRAVVWAIVEAAPLVEKSWLLLPRLVRLAGHVRDRALASRAATTVRDIAEDLRLPLLEQTEEISPLLVEQWQALRRLAADRKVSLDVRVNALLALAQLGNVLPDRPTDSLLGFLDDPEPRMREAAVELFAVGAQSPALEQLARRVSSERSARVARAAAVVLCARVAPRRRAHQGQAEYAALRTARALPRIRQMVEALDATDDQLVDLARCLARSRAAEDRRALAQLRRRSLRVRRLLRRLR